MEIEVYEENLPQIMFKLILNESEMHTVLYALDNFIRLRQRCAVSPELSKEIDTISEIVLKIKHEL